MQWRSMLQGTRITVRLLSLWLAGDVLYASLPLMVLFLLTVLLQRASPDSHVTSKFFELKEWSFATIVLFGVAIRRFVRLKYEIQQTPRSFKVDTGIQLFVACLILTVVVLSLVVLDEGGYFAEGVIPRHLGRAQLVLFVSGMLSLLVTVYAEEFGRRWTSVQRLDSWTLERLNADLLKIEERLLQVVQAIDRVPLAGPAGLRPADRDENRLRNIASATLERVPGLLTAIQDRVTFS